jgi:peptidoglycan-associated lipoprotein
MRSSLLVSRRLMNRLIAIAGLAVSVALLAGCPKPKPPPAETDATPPPRARVEITEVRPSSTTEGTAVTVTIEGWGFEDGSEVFLGGLQARGVDVYDGSELTFRASKDLRAGSYDVRVVIPDGDQAVSPGGFRVHARDSGAGDCVLRTVFFEFNEFKLADSTRRSLSDNAACIEKSGLKRLRLEGHADERGSTDYNLSLGQRRADSVRTYLVNLGISGDRIRTVSYGEEQPAEHGFTERAWAKNRRVEFIVP